MLDRAQAFEARQEALHHLAAQCRDAMTFQMLAATIKQPGEDASLRGDIVRVLPRWEDRFFPWTAVTTALAFPELRQAAIETLNGSGHLKAEMEARLTRELETMTVGEVKYRKVSMLPKLYGKDRRVLEYLRSLAQTGNRWERSLAFTELWGLGEVALAIAALDDPEPLVRRSMAAAIGRFKEESSVAALKKLQADTDVTVSAEAALSLRQLGIIRPLPTARSFDWGSFLKQLSEFRLSDPTIARKISAEKCTARWLGELAATEQEIATLEARLGQRLPPSFRSFLAVANGFDHPSSFLPRLLSTREVDWFEVHHSDWANAYRESYPSLGRTLQVSAVGDGAVLLLNPEVISSDGEWQADFFSNWNPGVTAFSSLGEYMERQLRDLREWQN